MPPSESAFEALGRAVEGLSRSSDEEARRLAETMKGDVRAIEGAMLTEPVPLLYAEEVLENAKAMTILASQPAVDPLAMESLRALAEDLRIKAVAVRQRPEFPAGVPPAPPFTTPQPVPYPSPRLVPPPKTMPLPVPYAPSKTMPMAAPPSSLRPPGPRFNPGQPAAQAAHLPSPKVPLPVPPVLTAKRDPQRPAARMIDEVRFWLVNYRVERLPRAQVPAKSMPSATPYAGGSLGSGLNLWLRSVRVQTLKSGREEAGIDVYYIARGRARDKVARDSLKQLGTSLYQGLLPWGNYLMLATRAELPAFIELGLFKNVTVQPTPTPTAGVTAPLSISLDVR